MSSSSPSVRSDLLILNFACDARHTALGFSLGWITELAKSYRNVDVITLFEGEHALPKNVRVHAISAGPRRESRIRRITRFYSKLASILRTRSVQVCFVHMAAPLGFLFAPVGHLTGIPMVLWYAHGTVGPIARLTGMLSKRVVTSTPHGFPLLESKRRVIGQGINFDAIDAARARGLRPPVGFVILSIGRTSRVKRLDVLLEAAAVASSSIPSNWTLRFVGEPLTAEDRVYEAELRTIASRLNILDRIAFAGPRSYEGVAEELVSAHVFLNASATGSLDKALVEAVGAGVITISSNPAYGGVASKVSVPWLVTNGTPADFARSIAQAAASWQIREPFTNELAAEIKREHSLAAFITRLRSVLDEVAL